MNAMHGSACYRIIGVNAFDDWGLFVDYVADSAISGSTELLERVKSAPDIALSGWQARQRLIDGDLFEIESVCGDAAAQEAVAFWRNYFRALGRTIIDSPLGCLLFQS